jgi:putative transposase
MLKGTRDYEIAVDLTQIPYHGQPQESAEEVMRGKAKSGTTHFHGYVTVSLVHTQRRFVLALLFVRQHDTRVDLVRRALEPVQRLKIRIRRVLLDAGFCTIAVFRALDRRGVSVSVSVSVSDSVPLKLHGKSGGVRKLFHGRRSYPTPYTLHSPAQGEGAYTVQAVVVCRYSRGRFKRHGVRWFAYAVAGLTVRGAASCRAVFEWYRRRFGIESSYRLMNHVRARTASRNPVFRLLLVGLALILVNLYTLLRSSLTECPTRARAWLSLRRIGSMIAHAVEFLFGIAPVLQRHSIPLLS